MGRRLQAAAVLLSLVTNLVVGSLVMQSYYFRPPSIIEQQAVSSENMKPWSDLRVAIYMTTHLSDEHRGFLTKCWVKPTIERLPLLRDADLILYTSSIADDHIINQLPFQNTTIKRYSETKYPDENRRKQDGAIQAIHDAFKLGWFQSYDWIIRLNPDVLIRRDEWLRKTMLNSTVDAILIPYLKTAIHTDFTVFRPSAVNKDKLFKSRINNAEFHMYVGFEELIESGRVQYLPNTQRIGGAARVVGKYSDVIHHHELLNFCPDYFNATDGKFF